SISRMRKGYVPPAAATDSSKSYGWSFLLKQIQDGVRYIRSNHSIIPLYVIMLFLTMTIRTINSLLGPFVQDVLHAGTEGFGYIDASFALGSIAGGILLPVIFRRVGQVRAMTGGLFLIALGLGFFSVSFAVWFAMFAYFLMGLAFQVRVMYVTAAQQKTDLEYQGRVHATFNMFFSIASLLIYVVIGVLSEMVNLRWIYMFQGVLLAMAGLYAVLLFRSSKTNKSASSAA
ncbi:MAG: MFS transporter, partial [Tumebacillaceae bacterium]